ncbi:hypothetical protein [Clostridium frigidicarnis]|uniref:Uncharacterized protein n=1 Tax=Clostridium frigidicarnis TaxID=84698 RepID=A0A1I1B921_9CLOT|nr:hypothetical protein [Clostridium frigidicarnis]SFB46282.1 hypothetical protein SAMN04488528_10747 [Clostridium frigidicarnis]
MKKRHNFNAALLLLCMSFISILFSGHSECYIELSTNNELEPNAYKDTLSDEVFDYDFLSSPTFNHISNDVALVDWWNDGSSLFSVGTHAKVVDIESGNSFNVERTTGTNHADAETLTKNDTNVMKTIWKGFSWERRPVYLIINNKTYAASMSAMPHAGIDSEPWLKWVTNRSGNFNSGQNLDFIKNNDMDGHIDIHFLNSTRHMDNKKDPDHQAAVKKASKI